MGLYVGIDLHSSNSVLAVQDEEDHVISQKRLSNDLPTVLSWLQPYRDSIVGIVVESTYNWYWLVDGLRDAGYEVHLANTTAIQQYTGLKYADDKSDARWLAKLLRLGQLPEGYIYPKEQRPVRDLVRKRSHHVRHCTSHILSIENLITRNTGQRINSNRVKRLTDEEVEALFLEPDLGLAVRSSLAVVRCLQEQIHLIEKAVKQRVRLRQEFKRLLTVNGIGVILGLTIMLETGDIRRFASVGDYVSYCRCVKSVWLSNGKKKGKGNAKNGNKYLAWAFVEAANFAIRFNEQIRRFYQRKSAKTKRVVALNATAHKLARACYHIMNDGVSFDVTRAFG